MLRAVLTVAVRRQSAERLTLDGCWGEHPWSHVSQSFASYLWLSLVAPCDSYHVLACDSGFFGFPRDFGIGNGVSAPSSPFSSCYSSAFSVRIVSSRLR